ncbi:MAG: hypothetical protein EHM54_02085 [Nitrospiraceae bacterium]|nr:MAG: hypothetical protein EHM54_02085 [Nitrospiraceae bacterium]
MKSEANKIATLALIALSLIFLSTGCSNIDKDKFRELRKSARAIDKAVKDTLLPYGRFEELLQKMTDEMTKTRALVSTEEEKALLGSYEELFMTYQEADLLWEHKIESSVYGWIPRGRIYVDEKLRPLVEKYHFPTEPHFVELTGHRFESISADSIKVIWEKAHEQIKKVRY